MFSHFIYFIIALLILSLYRAPDTLPFSFPQALLLIIGLCLVYGLYARFLFNRLIKRQEWESQAILDHDFGLYSTRCSILSLVLLAADIWWLHLPAFLDELTVFALLPTLRSLLLLLMFVGYLTLMWAVAYPAHRAIYRTDISLGNYIYSNVAFSIPVLVPWTLLFGLHDIIQLLPYELPQRILETNIGQTSYFLAFLIITAIFAPVLIQKFWRCRPLEAGEQRSRIEALCRQAGIQYADIVHWPIFGGRMITAGVMGLVARFRYILVTDALLNMLTPDEVDQVIAHEIGHVKHRHLLLYLLFFIGFMLISYTVFPVADLLVFSLRPVRSLIEAMQFSPTKFHDIVLGVTLILCIIIYFRYIFGYFIRNFERQADTYVFRLFPDAQPLISTFDKIVASSGQPADKPNWHHFSIQQRIDYLYQCEQSKKWITLHNKKVARSIAIYIACIIAVGAISFQLKGMIDPSERNVAIIEAYLEDKETKTHDDSLLYLLVGNYYYDKKNHNRAVAAYEASLTIAPDTAEVLNNLAWLLATTTNSSLFNPERALELAEKAISLKKEPHIWDTLAESLFVNGRIEEAIEAEKQALKMNPKDKIIYEDQLARFEQALEQNAINPESE